MEFTLASDGTNNAYFDRIIQSQVELDLRELKFCLTKCALPYQAHRNPHMSLEQRLCLCTT